MLDDEDSEIARTRTSGVPAASAAGTRFERGVAREVMDGRYYADGQAQVRETDWWLGTPAAWAESPQKASGEFNSILTRFGLVLALRSCGY